jgi:hypothetical protein
MILFWCIYCNQLSYKLFYSFFYFSSLQSSLIMSGNLVIGGKPRSDN